MINRVDVNGIITPTGDTKYKRGPRHIEHAQHETYSWQHSRNDVLLALYRPFVWKKGRKAYTNRN